MHHHFYFLFFKGLLIYFKIIFYWLCYYSCPDFSPFALLHPALPTCLGNPPPLFTSMGHVYKFFGYSISCTVLYIPLPTYLYFLIPSPLLSFRHTLSHLATIKTLPKSMILSLFFLFALFFCFLFLDSIVDRYVFLLFYCS